MMTSAYSTKFFTMASSIALAMVLVGCDGNDTPATPPVAVVPPPAPMPTPTPPPITSANFDVTPCLNQIVVPGRTVADLVVPDVLRLDIKQAPGFPNGRRYLDPVVDVTLAVIFLDLRVHDAGPLARVPVNPNGIDQPLPLTFPFLAPPLGTPPTSGGAGSRFTFRTDPASAYVRVDRAGMPAVSTALITGIGPKNAYNDADPAADATGRFVGDLSFSLTALTNGLADDLVRLGLSPCARAI